MVWCHERKIIFVHIPKTAGSSIEKALGLFRSGNENGYGYDSKVIDGRSVALQHLLPGGIRKIIGEEAFSRYTKFTVCRNPYNRIVSEYHWRARNKLLPVHRNPYNRIASGYHWRARNKLGPVRSFDSFLDEVENVIKNNLFNSISDHLIPQSDFIYDSEGNQVVDHLFRFEKLDKVEQFLQDNFGTNKLEHLEASIPDVKKIVLTNEQKERVYKLYERDFRLLGYDK
jgi:hypothetical protein